MGFFPVKNSREITSDHFFPKFYALTLQGTFFKENFKDSIWDLGSALDNRPPSLIPLGSVPKLKVVRSEVTVSKVILVRHEDVHKWLDSEDCRDKILRTDFCFKQRSTLEGLFKGRWVRGSKVRGCKVKGDAGAA